MRGKRKWKGVRGGGEEDFDGGLLSCFKLFSVVFCVFKLPLLLLVETSIVMTTGIFFLHQAKIFTSYFTPMHSYCFTTLIQHVANFVNLGICWMKGLLGP